MKTYLEDGEQFPAIVHMILAFVVKKKPDTIKNKQVKHVPYQVTYKTQDQVEQHLPVIWIVFLFVHYHSFKHMAFTHHKLYHPVDKE